MIVPYANAQLEFTNPKSKRELENENPQKNYSIDLNEK